MLCTIYPKQDIYNVSTLIQNVERIVYNGDHYILVSILIKTHEWTLVTRDEQSVKRWLCINHFSVNSCDK